MTYTLPRYVKPGELCKNSEFLEYAGDDACYRLADFDGLSDHDKLLRKLEIMQLRGSYSLCDQQFRSRQS